MGASKLARRARWLMAVALAAMLAGCATATVVQEDASQVSASTQAAITATRAFYTRLAESRRDYRLAVLASDPECGLSWRTLVVPDETRPFGWRCLTDAEKRARQDCLDEPPPDACTAAIRDTLVTRATLLDLDDAERQTALALVDAIATYQIALATILVDPTFDAKPTVTALRDQVNTLRATIAALQGEPFAATDYKAQVAAITTLSNLIARLAEDRRDMTAQRALMASDGEAFAADLEALLRRYENLDRQQLLAFDGIQLQRRVARFNDGQRKLSEEKRFDQMRDLADDYAALRQRQLAPDALVASWRAIATMHAQLQRAVVDGELGDAQRRRVVKQSLAQFQVAFDAILALAAWP